MARKRLYILRHAKAGQTNKKISEDKKRPLSPRGIEACPYIGQYLAKAAPHMDLVLCSTATRTVETAKLVLAQRKGDVPVEYLSQLYLADAAEILAEINVVDDGISQLLVVGHNPGLQQLCIALAGKERRSVAPEIRTYFPPGSLACFELECESWDQLDRGQARLVDYTTPKELELKEAS